MSYNCTSFIPSIRNFSQSILITLRATNSCIALLNIFSNGFLIYALKKTGQTTSFSIQLIVLMSSSDCINGVVALIFTNLLLWKTYDSYCFLKVTSQFVHIVFRGYSFISVLLIATDRFLHMKYLQRYPTIVTKKRGRIVALAACLLQLFIAFVSSMPFLKEVRNVGKLVQICAGILGMICIFILYYKTTKAVKHRIASMHNCFMRSTVVYSKAIANMALSISICTGLLFTPYLIGVIIINVSKMSQDQNATDLAIFIWFTYLCSLANGVCSCIIFIVQNKPVKRLIKEVIMT